MKILAPLKEYKNAIVQFGVSTRFINITQTQMYSYCNARIGIVKKRFIIQFKYLF